MAITHRPILTAAGLAALAFAAPAAAAQQAENPIEACKTNSKGKKQRIACLEQALAEALNLNVASAQEASSPAASEETPTAVADETPTELADAAPSAPKATGIGAEQVAAREVKQGKAPRPDKKRETAMITDFSTTNAGRFIIFLDNGQIWRQRKSDAFVLRLSKHKEYEVEVYEGAISGYRMRIPGASKTIRVERLK